MRLSRVASGLLLLVLVVLAVRWFEHGGPFFGGGPPGSPAHPDWATSEVSDQERAELQARWQLERKILESLPAGQFAPPSIDAVFNQLSPDEQDLAAGAAFGLWLRFAVEYHKQGRFDEAAELFAKLLSIQERLYPPDQFPDGHLDLAICLNNLAFALHSRGDHEAARERYERALAMFRRLLPEDEHPAGHPEMARSLMNLGALLAGRGEFQQAQQRLEQAAALYERLNRTQPSPARDFDWASCLDQLAVVLRDRGDYEQARRIVGQALELHGRKLSPAEAADPQVLAGRARCLDTAGGLFQLRGDFEASRRYFEQSLQAYREMYPAGKFPQGHPNLAISLENLAALLASQGEYEQARDYYEQALAMQRRVYPPERYPQGHPDVARCLVNLAALLHRHGELEQAREYNERAVAQWSRLYPPDKHPQGHPELARALNNQGRVLSSLDRPGEARDALQAAWEMRRKLYPEDDYPRGHIDLAGSLDELGQFHLSQQDDDEARRCFDEALAMRRRLYPAESYPLGHPEQIAALRRLGTLLHRQRQHEEALAYFEQAAEMTLQLSDEFFAAASEAEALNFAANYRMHDWLLSLWPHAGGRSDGDLYRYVGRSRGAIYRVMRQRQQWFNRSALFDETPLAADETSRQPNERRNSRSRVLGGTASGTSSDGAEAYRDYLQTRREIARLTLAPADPDDEQAAARRAQLAELSRRKEHLERELAGGFPGGAGSPIVREPAIAELTGRLPQDAALIDLVQYVNFGETGEQPEPAYAAFVLCRDKPVVRVELGSSEPIDRAVHDWREDIAAGRRSEAADELSRRVWQPLAAHLPERTETVWLCPDGRLTALPWAALPGSRPSTVLLEEYALAVLPHAQFLLDQAAADRPRSGETDRLLAVGDVDYDGLQWPLLPGTRSELNEVLALAGARNVVELRHEAASTRRVLHELPGARWAHLATHGFFAEPELRSALQLDEAVFSRSGPAGAGDRGTVAGRNPLVLSGLVLSGANRRPIAGGWGLSGEGGILTAEAIAALPLEGLELAVLSACETGLGDVAGGEGVFGLQRAFHLAGAQNVVGSLWRVSDEATAALMRLFYYNLWNQNKSPAEALRAAQLTLYRRPDAVKLIGTERAPDFQKLADLPPPSSTPDSTAGPTAETRYWAGFVLSGTGN